MMKFERKDIVRLREPKFEELKEALWFKDNAFEITKMEEGGMALLLELDTPIPVEELLSMPIGRKYSGNVYYDPIITGSVLGPNDKIPVHTTDYSYFMDAFGRVKDVDGNTLLALVEEQKFKYVHEVQHWLRKRYGSDDLKIHHKLITLAEIQCQTLWELRERLTNAGVSTYRFLYEMANMLYLRWISFYDEREAERWKELERTSGDEKLEKYQQAIKRIKQETRIYSVSALDKAIKTVSLCAKKENIAELFDLILQRNSKTKDGGATHNATPKVLAQLLVEVMQPKLGEYWYDPAAGFSGFLVEINNYLRKNNDNYQNLKEEDRKFQIMEALSGIEIQKEVARIGFCNTRFHGLWCDVKNDDSLKSINYQHYEGIICEPPIQMFSMVGKQGTEGSNKNKQLEFVELILKSMNRQFDGRAAVLLPEIFFNKSSREYSYVRKQLFEEYSNHAILRLPIGIYPNTNISMCALFITCRPNYDGKVLVYDMQSEKMKPEQLQDIKIFNGFIKAYREGNIDKRGSLLSIDYIRETDYQIKFGISVIKEKEQMETPSYYLSEANKLVRDIRSLLSKMEKEING